jgi:uncharacterized protein (TIGR00255 family)
MTSPLSSMTGFSREGGSTGPYDWAWELRCVNGRGFDLRLRLPPGFDALGEDVRKACSAAIRRGSLQVNLSLNRAESVAKVRINEDVLSAVLSAVSRLDLPPGMAPLTMDGLMAVRGVVEAQDGDDESELRAALDADLRQGLGKAVAGLVAARNGEGLALHGVIGGQLDRMAQARDAAQACPARQPDAIRARLAAQVAQLLDVSAGLDPARLHQEAVLIAVKADIREELDRLAAHIAAARALLSEGGAVGRKLDFLAQEFAREANTLCAKANDASLSAIGLDLKASVEQFREQVQNVE